MGGKLAARQLSVNVARANFNDHKIQAAYSALYKIMVRGEMQLCNIFHVQDYNLMNRMQQKTTTLHALKEIN
jgi:hypothetical protein